MAAQLSLSSRYSSPIGSSPNLTISSPLQVAEQAEDVYGYGYGYDGGRLFAGHLHHGLEVAQLESHRVLGNNVSRLSKGLCCLILSMGMDDLGSPIPLCLRLPGHGPLHMLGEKDILDLLIKQNLETKYRLSPILLYNHSYDTNRYPFLDFTWLIRIRNDVIHYEMPFYDETDSKPRWVNFLKHKGIFLDQPVVHPPAPIPDEGRRIWIEEICTFKGAKWAYNTSCSMIKEYFNMAEGVIKSTCQPWVDSIAEL